MPAIARVICSVSFSAADLVQILDIAPIEGDRFRGQSPKFGWRRIFGGLIIAQSLVAAMRTVADRMPHGLHGLFLRPGDPLTPIDYQVERLRDGASFSARRCVAIQHGRPIFTLSVSFQAEESGLDHGFPMPDVPAPEDLPDEAGFKARFGAVMPEPLRRYLDQERPIEFRPVDEAAFLRRPGPAVLRPSQAFWMRAKGPLPDEPRIHAAVLAYLSDMTLLDSALIAHGRSVFDADLQAASLDHALWFHRAFRADSWLLYTQDSPNAAGGRGFTRGQIFAADGRLVASVAQEGLIRLRPYQ